MWVFGYTCRDMLFHAFPVPEFLDRAARAFPHKAAVDFMGRRITFEQMRSEASMLAVGLIRELGIGKGQRVGLLLPNCPAYITCYNAILLTGAVVVNINPLYSEEEITKLVEDSGLKILITLDVNVCYQKVRPLVEMNKVEKVIMVSMSRQLPWLKGMLLSLFRSHELAPVPKDDTHVRYGELMLAGENRGGTPLPAINPHDLAVLQYTGGTTGVPKAAMLTHANVSINAQQCGEWFSDINPGEHTMLAVLPFFHSFAMTAVMNFSLLKAATMILHPKFNLEKILRDIHEKRPTLLCGVPTMFTAIINSKELEKYKLDSLKACISGGAPLPVEVKKEFERLTGCTLIEGYGLSEASPVCAANPFRGENRAGSIGLPFPDTEIAIENREDPGTFLEVSGPQNPGEICVRGPQVMQGYLNQPEETAKILFNGWLRTGDLGYKDPDGYIHVVDRIKEMILSGGFNVYPRQIEEAIYQHPAVEECAVIGVPDSYFGQVPKAFVVKKPNTILDEEKLHSFLSAKLANYAKPRTITFVDGLPKTLIGKVDKKKLT